jgi:hypothetical protein
MLCLDLQGSRPSRIGTHHAVLVSPGFASSSSHPMLLACYLADLLRVSWDLQAKEICRGSESLTSGRNAVGLLHECS